LRHAAWIPCFRTTAGVSQGQKPRRGDLFIEERDPPPFFLFFRGAGLARLSNSPPAAPLKNKKKKGVAALVL